MTRGAIVLLAALLTAPGLVAAVPPGTGLLLPVTDRVGDPEMARSLEAELLDRLGREASLADSTGLRDALRALRIRDFDRATPQQLDDLAKSFGARWMFSATVHRAVRTPTPVLTVSARVYSAGSPQLTGAALFSATGLDGRKWLMLGGTDEIGDLVSVAAGTLLADCGPPDPTKTRRGPDPGRVAVVPFDAVAGDDPGTTAAMFTDLVLAELHRRGIETLLPAHVRAALERRGSLPHQGQVDHETMRELREEFGVSHVLTGVVERFDAGYALEPDPHVAFSARMLDTATLRIVWIDGDERRGRQSESLFRMGRIYSGAELARRMLRTLFDRLPSGGDS